MYLMEVKKEKKKKPSVENYIGHRVKITAVSEKESNRLLA